jgi:hypothetical protein
MQVYCNIVATLCAKAEKLLYSDEKSCLKIGCFRF